MKAQASHKGDVLQGKQPIMKTTFLGASLRASFFKRRSVVAILVLSSLFAAMNAHSSLIAGWDFFGENTGVATSPADVFDANLDSSSSVTRGAGAAASTANNSFRTTGFENNGISTANNDYFQVTLSAANGFMLSLSTIDARFAGTATFRASPGVSAQFAYSLDGTTFNLIGSAFSLTTDTAMPQISLTGISDLQNVPDSTTAYFRYYASGQTATGGWGFNSPGSGQDGLDFGGTLTAVPEPVTWALIVFGALFSAVQLGRLYRRHLAAC
jgi:hypothetical protein